MTLFPPTEPLRIFLAAALASLAATGIAAQILERLAILDRPNDRSSHAVPVPRGGGWGIWLAVIPIWIGLAIRSGDWHWLAWLWLGLLPLLVVSAWDDCRPLSPLIRFGTQIAAIWLGFGAVPKDALFFQGILPLALDHVVAGIGWLWFVNLFNFMDGIDGITGLETLSIGLGLAALGVLTGKPGPMEIMTAALLAGAALGFLAHNWHPARLFLGDVGSIPLGFLLGWLLLALAGSGLWAPALLLPLYYLADSTLTLLARLWRREKIWLPHRTHFYQKATAPGRSKHDRIVLEIALLNSALIAFSLGAALFSPWFLVPGFVATALTLRRFGGA